MLLCLHVEFVFMLMSFTWLTDDLLKGNPPSKFPKKPKKPGKFEHAQTKVTFVPLVAKSTGFLAAKKD